MIYAHLDRVIARERPQLHLRHRSGTRGPGDSRKTRGSRGATPTRILRSWRDGSGMQRLFKQFSFPVVSRATLRRRRRASIHEGGELGYSLSHAFGAAFDNPDLVVACVIGDGEAETGPLATSWQFEQVSRTRSAMGAVLPSCT